MQLCKVSELFEVTYGVDLELNAMEIDSSGINFVARTSKDNGVSARVKPLPYIKPNVAGTLSVAAGGSVMETFLQPEPYYSGRDLFVLTPKVEMSDAVKLYYCMCLRRNKFKYSYGRQANETLPDLLIPTLDEIPDYAKNISLAEAERQLVESVKIEGLEDKAEKTSDTLSLIPLNELFEMHNGISSDNVLKSERKESDNWVPFIRPSYRQATSIDAYVNKTLVPSHKIFPQGTLYVSTNGQGSHTYSYVSATEFVPNSDVCALIPKRKMCLREKLFYAMCITRNRFKFSYGRKPKGEKLGCILLPEFIPEIFNDTNLQGYVKEF